MNFSTMVAVGCALALGACKSDRPVQEPTSNFESMAPQATNADSSGGLTLKSSAFGPGAPMDRRFTREGGDVSPPLAWSRAPEGTKSFVVMCIDEDAKKGAGGYTHWVDFDIPASVRGLAEGANAGVQGKNDAGKLGWAGPKPPAADGPHHYVFHVAALDVSSLQLPEGASRADVERAMRGHVLAAADLTATYEHEK